MLTTRVVFHCRECHAALSEPVRRAAEREINRAAGQELVPMDAYTIVKEWGSVLANQQGEPIESYVPDVPVVNQQNQRWGKDHADYSRSIGCCGPTANMQELNWLCPNDHEVGALQGECVFDNGLGFHPACVYLSDSDDRELPADAAPELRTFATTYPTILALAQGIATAPYLDGLYALADALEESGYANGRILEHLRADITHHEGCIVLDWLLGK